MKGSHKIINTRDDVEFYSTSVDKRSQEDIKMSVQKKGKNISSANVREQLTAVPAIFPCDILPTDEHC